MLPKVIIERRAKARPSRQPDPAGVAVKPQVTECNFPIACPQCAAQAGRPLRAEQVSNQQLKIRLRCDQCANEWELGISAPPLIRTPARNFSQ